MRRIAVVIPYYNAQAWLSRCLNSIDERFKVVLIDDNSSDGSREIADAYAQAHPSATSWSVAVPPFNVSAARNTGLLYLFHVEDIDERPDYITFLDADDAFTPDAWAQINAAIDEAEGAEIIQLNHKRQRGEGPPTVKFWNRRGWYGLRDLPTLWVLVWNKVYKTEILKGVRFDTDLIHGEDELFNLECLAKTRGIYNSERVAVTHYFNNPQSLSNTCTGGDLIAEQRALLCFIADHQGDEDLTEAVRLRQLELWTNKKYRQTFGGLA